MIRRVIFLGIIGIIGILMIQSYLLYKNFDLKEKEFDQQVRVALLKVAKNLAKYNESSLPTQNLIKRITPNYYAVNINDVIDANVLEYYLYKELEDVQLVVDFEYAIYDCATDAMLYGDYCTTENITADQSKKQDLPKYNEFIYYFGVRFPHRGNVLINDPSLPLFMAGILLLTLFLFGYSLYVILKQKRMAEMQRDFINNMTHEFKTPLSSIKLASESFLNHPTIKADDRLIKYAQIISDQNERLHEQVIKVLSLSRMEKNEFHLNKADHELIPMIQDCIRNFKMSLSNNIEINLDTSLGNDIKVNLDAFHFRNIMSNLFDNAVKYNKNDSPINIRINSVAPDKIVISVEDSGIGINKEDQAQMFDKYFRAHTGDVHNVKGFGLGLYYVKQVVDAHGWKITSDSELSVGTKISIILDRDK